MNGIETAANPTIKGEALRQLANALGVDLKNDFATEDKWETLSIYADAKTIFQTDGIELEVIFESSQYLPDDERTFELTLDSLELDDEQLWDTKVRIGPSKTVKTMLPYSKAQGGTQ